MGSQSDAQRLQAACQDMLKKEGAFSGFLRRKTILHKLCEGFAEQFTSKISWQRRYIVVYDGFLYNYKSETDNKPAKVIDLCQFQRVEKDDRLKAKGVPWPLKISSDIPGVKILYFGATSEPELKKWIGAVKKGIDEAKKSGRVSVAFETKEDSLPKQMKMPRKKESKHSEEDNGSDGEEEYSVLDNSEDEYLSGSDYSSIDEQEPTSSSSSSFGNATVPSIEMKSSAPSVNKTPKAASRDNKATTSSIDKTPTAPSRDKKPTTPSIEKAHAATSRNNSQTDSIDSKSSVSSKNTPPTETTPRKTPIATKNKPDPAVCKKPLPKEEPVAVDIVSEATWTGSAEAGIEIMKSISEEGVFMLRESTTGQGELTLQVTSDFAIRKYRITKEGRQFRMTGGNTFDSIFDLLKFYQMNSIPNRTTKLTKPYSKI